jgi:DNA (cytosine-5)-methyltransferase 1
VVRVTLTIGSLFSGIAGLELGLLQAGHGPVLWHVESDEFCRAVLTKHFPDARQYGDVTTFAREEVPEGLPAAVDIICGGFP